MTLRERLQFLGAEEMVRPTAAENVAGSPQFLKTAVSQTLTGNPQHRAQDIEITTGDDVEKDPDC